MKHFLPTFLATLYFTFQVRASSDAPTASEVFAHRLAALETRFIKPIAKLISDQLGPTLHQTLWDMEIRPGHHNQSLPRLPRKHNRLKLLGEWMKQNPSRGRPTAQDLCTYKLTSPLALVPGGSLTLWYRSDPATVKDFLDWVQKQDVSDNTLRHYANEPLLCEQQEIRSSEGVSDALCDKNDAKIPKYYESKYVEFGGFYKAHGFQPYCQACWAEKQKGFGPHAVTLANSGPTAVQKKFYKDFIKKSARTTHQPHPVCSFKKTTKQMIDEIDWPVEEDDGNSYWTDDDDDWN